MSTDLASRPRVLVIHNRYQQAGGEDSVFDTEVALLRDGGCAVDTLVISNDGIRGARAQMAAAAHVVSNRKGRRMVADALERFRPDVVHVHNFFPQLSPAVFDACRTAGVPAVWTLHNFRVACANGLLFRDGRPCEDCLGRIPLPALAHRCYRNSLAGSAAVATMIAWHRATGTWRHKVSRFIALTDFSRDIAVRAGIPAERVVVKANTIPDPLPTLGDAPASARAGALYVGRLSVEKGVDVLVEAWRRLPHIPLTIIGDGPEQSRLEAIAPANVRFTGSKPRDAVLLAIRATKALIIPSTCYENFPMTAVEAMALATPLIASRIGALASIVEHGVNGLHFLSGDPDDLAQVVATAFAEPGRLEVMGHSARIRWEAQMSPARNLDQLHSIYADAIADGA